MRIWTKLVVVLVASPSMVLNISLVRADANESCRGYSEFAEQVMTMRQAEVPVFDVIDEMTAIGFADDLEKLLKGMILDAYERPAYNSEQLQKRAIKEFTNSMALSCLQKLG